MLRIFSAARRFPKAAPVVFFSYLLAGCSSGRQLSVADMNEVLHGMNGAAQPTVLRSQKPDDHPATPAEKKSILDLVSYETAGPTDSRVAARIRATVNGVAILDDEVRGAIFPFLIETARLPEPERSARRKEAFDRELQHLVEREMILQEMFARLKNMPLVMDKLKDAAAKEFDKKMKTVKKGSGFKSDEEMKAFYRSQGLSLEGIRRQVEREFMAMEYMRNLIVPAIERIGHKEIQEYYDGHPEEFQVADSVTWQDIFINANQFPSRAEAKALADQLAARGKGGEDFHALVKQYDQGDSSYRDGEGFGHKRGEIKPREAEAVLFELTDGQIGPVLEQPNGYHVIKLVKRVHAGKKPFDEKVQTAVKNKLQNETWEREYKRILASMKRKSEIEISTGTP